MNTEKSKKENILSGYCEKCQEFIKVESENKFDYKECPECGEIIEFEL